MTRVSDAASEPQSSAGRPGPTKPGASTPGRPEPLGGKTPGTTGATVGPGRKDGGSAGRMKVKQNSSFHFKCSLESLAETLVVIYLQSVLVTCFPVPYRLNVSSSSDRILLCP